MKNFTRCFLLCSVVLAFVMNSCSNDQTERPEKEVSSTHKLPIVGADWKEIGYIKDGQIVLTIETDKALERLSMNMKMLLDIEEVFTSMYVVEFEEGNNLLFEGTTHRSSFYVATVAPSRVMSSTAASKILVANPKITCTTSDCASEPTGCIVKYDNDDTGLPYCSPCANGGKCTKTSVSSAADLF